MKQPEALQLAEMIERYNAGVMSQRIVEDYQRAADELRKLHAKLERLEREGLRAAIKEAESVEPVAYIGKKVADQLAAGIAATTTMTTHMASKDDVAIYPAPPAARPAKSLDILMVTTAYEQGVGKGHQAHAWGIEIACPYATGDCTEAWQLGYQEGKKQAAPAQATFVIKEQP